MSREELYDRFCPDWKEQLQNMKILMLGNTFTTKNDLPGMISELTGATVVNLTRSGATLAEFSNCESGLGMRLRKALSKEKWDYVILQEKGDKPIKNESSFVRNLARLCKLIRENNAKPILFATWTYKHGGTALDKMKRSYESMFMRLYLAFHTAAASNNILVADVGEVFYKLAPFCNMYDVDGAHPSKRGSIEAAWCIENVIKGDIVTENVKQVLARFRDTELIEFDEWNIVLPELLKAMGFKTDCEGFFLMAKKLDKDVYRYDRQGQLNIIHTLEKCDRQIIGDYLYTKLTTMMHGHDPLYSWYDMRLLQRIIRTLMITTLGKGGII